MKHVPGDPRCSTWKPLPEGEASWKRWLVEASVHEVVEEPVVVGVRMVAVPVENIRPHIEVVSWNVARGISDRVPHRKEDALLSWRCGDDAHSQWHLHRALLDLVRRRTGRRPPNSGKAGRNARSENA